LRIYTTEKHTETIRIKHLTLEKRQYFYIFDQIRVWIKGTVVYRELSLEITLTVPYSLMIGGWDRMYLFWQGVVKVSRMVEDARKGGAELVMGGEPHPAGGLFYKPTILTQGNTLRTARILIY